MLLHCFCGTMLNCRHISDDTIYFTELPYRERGVVIKHWTINGKTWLNPHSAIKLMG